MLLGYNTNGFPHHRLEDTLTILADLGYQSVAITLDHHALDPFDENLAVEVSRIRHRLEQLNLASVIETGARFLLDPWRKHQPTLLSERPEERALRLGFLKRAVDIAAELGAGVVSFWSGAALTATSKDVLLSRLVDGCKALADHAETRNVRLAFEPEPGMFIDTLATYQELGKRAASPFLGLTIDIGHLHCMGEVPIADQLQRWQDLVWNIHIEDMRRGVHEHLLFGEGEIDFPPIMRTLQEIGYSGGVHVELSRHGHDAVETARRAIAVLRTMYYPTS
jgi:sugar phosphate isomerase/epimerase